MDAKELSEVEVKGVEFEDGRPAEDWTFNRIKVGQYERAFNLFEKRLEVQRIALALDKPLREVEALAPSSYERIVAADMAVNQRFFAYCRRQAEWKSYVLDVRAPSASTGTGSQQQPD